MLEIEDYEGEDNSIVRFSVEKNFRNWKKGVKIVRRKLEMFWVFKIQERVTKRGARTMKSEIRKMNRSEMINL